MDLFGLGFQESAIILLLVLVLVFYAAMIKHLLLQNKTATFYKFTWAAVIIFVPITGALLYYWFCVPGNKRAAAR